MRANVWNSLGIRDRSRHAGPQVFEFLRDQIVSLDLAPGTLLSRTALQEQFGVSSTPIRDALIRLQEEGLVEVFPQSATVVSPIDLEAARQAQFLRLSLELEVIGTLARTPDQDLIRRLSAIIAGQERLLGESALQEFTAADQAFHCLMFEAAGVPELWTLVRRHSGQIDRLRRLHLPIADKGQRIVSEHSLIMQALSTGDASLAQRRVREHLSHSLSHSDEIRADYPQYFRDRTPPGGGPAPGSS